MAKKILNVATFGLAGALLKPFGGGKKKEPAPATPERVMPLPDDEAVKRAQRTSLIRQRGRGGRASTILTGSSSGSTLGG